MVQPTDSDLVKFHAALSRLRVNDAGHMVGPEYFRASTTFRAYQVYWLITKGVWPGSLKKTCDVDRCLIHYEEKGHVLTKEQVDEIKAAPDYWGVVTDLAKKYGVTKARVSQIRKGQ